MKLLADENIEADIVSWLRSQDHDVVYAAEIASGYSDSILIKTARQQNRVLLTADKDFGELVFRQHRNLSGVVLLRLRAALQITRLQILQRHWPNILRRLPGSFVTVGNSRIRIRPMPAD